MKKISNAYKVTEEENTNVHDHRSPPVNNLRRFGSSEIRFTLSLNLCQENYGGTLVLKDSDMDTTPELPVAVPGNSEESSSLVYSPIPLRWSHTDFDFPSSDRINRVGESVRDDHEGNEITLRQSRPFTSRNPNLPIAINRLNSGSGSNDVVSPTVKDEAITELDLSLSLSITPLCGKKEKPSKPEKRGRSDYVVSPTVKDEAITELDLSLSLSIMPICGKKEKLSKPEKRGRSDGGDNAGEEGTEKKKRRITKRKRGDGEEQQPSIQIEEIPILQQSLESRGGTRPVFLYKKRLEESDVLKSQNRLLVTRAERVMEFLREEEEAAVNGGRGLKFVGVDGGGRVYEKMGLTKWAKSKVTVINSDWSKMVEANAAKRGDVVEIWGCRENQKLCFAFSFV